MKTQTQQTFSINELSESIQAFGLAETRRKYQSHTGSRLTVSGTIEKIIKRGEAIKLLLRLHLNESQRAMIAARLANMSVGNPQFSNSANLHNSVSLQESADLLNVSRRTVSDARNIQQNAIPELAEKVTQGAVSLQKAFCDFGQKADFLLHIRKNQTVTVSGHLQSFGFESVCLNGCSLSRVEN